MSKYDTRRLRDLGAKHKKLRAQLDDLRESLQIEIVAARRANIPQVEVIKLTGYTRSTVWKLERIAGIDTEKETDNDKN